MKFISFIKNLRIFFFLNYNLKIIVIKLKSNKNDQTFQNYFSISEDGTTAAERFFEQKHPNLSEYVVNNVKSAPRAYYKKGAQN